jgi:hypothetical protein
VNLNIKAFKIENSPEPLELQVKVNGDPVKCYGISVEARPGELPQAVLQPDVHIVDFDGEAAIAIQIGDRRYKLLDEAAPAKKSAAKGDDK